MTIYLPQACTWLLADSVRAIVEAEVMLALTISAVVIAMAGAALIFALRRAKGSTLQAPLVWAIVSLSILIVLEAAQLRYRTSDAVRTKWDFMGATSTLCPLIALLGAKRPQNRTWPLIVLALWGIVSLPAIESLVIHPHERFELHVVWQLFVGLLILLGCVNYLPTRFAVPALVAAFGQCVLLGGPIFGPGWWLPSFRPNLFTIMPILSSDGKTPGLRAWLIVAGILPLAVAICLAYLLGRRPRRLPSEALAPWNRVWRDFRDCFGLLWSMRLLERLNALSSSAESSIRLSWAGFRTTNSQDRKHSSSVSTDVSAAAHERWTASLGPQESTFRNLLGRFVSEAWINARLESGAATPLAAQAVSDRH